MEHEKSNRFKFFNTENGQVTLDILAVNKIDVCFIDWYLPVMDAQELIKNIHLDNTLNKVRTIVATAENLKENVIKMAKMGINAYLVKPFDKTSLTKVFNTACLNNRSKSHG